MGVMVADPKVQQQIIAERRAAGLDRFDEVWDGVYVIMPLPDDEHQQIATHVAAILQIVIGWPGLAEVRGGINVSDRVEGWTKNYRCPDVAAFLLGTLARNCGTHWVGGPDFATEIVSPSDRTREKFEFYETLRVKEPLLIDRDPWKLELYRLQEDKLVRIGESTPENQEVLESEIVPLTFRLIPGDSRPQIEIVHSESGQRWVV